MQINRTQSRNSVLGINTVILEEEAQDAQSQQDPSKDQLSTGRHETEKREKGKKYETLQNVKCVAIIDDVDKIFDNKESKSYKKSISHEDSMTEAPSFSSVFNSIIPVSEKTRTDGPAIGQTEQTKAKFLSLNSDLTPPNILHREYVSTDEYFKQERKEKTLSLALLLDESQIKSFDDLSKKKVPPQMEQVNAPRATVMGAMPSCYVISKDDYFKTKKFSFVQTVDQSARRTKKQDTSSQLNESNVSGIPGSPNSSMTPLSNTPSNYRRETNTSNLFLTEGSRKGSTKSSKNPITTGTQLIRENSLVSVVNKGSSSMLILKIQTYVKNYMDINPDFGWRRLIDDKNLPFSNFNNNSYMFYIESKKSTHIITPINLAINIACRTLILAITHGYLDLNLTPIFLVKYLPTHISNMLPLRTTRLLPTPPKMKTNESPSMNTGENKEDQTLLEVGQVPKYYYFKGGMDPVDKECGTETMYLKSNFLGIFAMSSLVRNLKSENYRKRYKINKKLPQNNLDESSARETNRGSSTVETLNQYTQYNSHPDNKTIKGFYNQVPIPEYGWKLVSRAQNDVEDQSKNQGLTNFFSKIFKKRPKFETLYPSTLLCKVRPPHNLQKNCKVVVDAGSLGMNIAEQLYRLEISTNNREKFPKNTFGFTSTPEGKVVCPDGSVVDFVPEEVILNTASLVHEIYITQTYLIL